MSRKYWIGVASLEHVQKGVQGGFAQVCHGKKNPLKRMKDNDVIFYYSPTTILGSKDKCQSFSAIGRICDNNVYKVQMSDDFSPYRRNVEFYQPIKLASIHNLINKLDFIDDPKKYGSKFRYGHFEISYHDALIIWNALKPNSIIN